MTSVVMMVGTPSEQALQLIGLAARAGAVAPGVERVRQKARAGEIRFAIVAVDASHNTRNKLLPLLRARRLPHSVAYRRFELGTALGRGGLSAVGITSESFATRLAALLESARK